MLECVGLVVCVDGHRCCVPDFVGGTMIEFLVGVMAWAIFFWFISEWGRK